MARTLCDWSKRDIEKKAEKLYELLRDPKFICRKCARVANQYEVLCKPKRMPPPPSTDSTGSQANNSPFNPDPAAEEV